MRAKSIKNTARINAELSPMELKNLLKKSQTANVSYQSYIQALEAELSIWRSGGQVDPANYAATDKLGVPISSTKKAQPPSTPSTTRSATPSIPAIESLRGDLDSRPQTPTVIGLDKDERDEFLRRENELTDQLGEKESALAAQQKLVQELREELNFVKESEASLSKVPLPFDQRMWMHMSNFLKQENKIISTQMSELRLKVERLEYDIKESNITIDILKEQNQDLTNELEDVKKFNEELKALQKDSSVEDKEKKKAEKMAIMMAQFDTVIIFFSLDTSSLTKFFLQQGAFSEKEELLRSTLAKLDAVDSDSPTSFASDDIALIRRQLTEGQQQIRDLMDKLLVAQETSEHHERRKAELEQRLTSLEGEYEELLGRKDSWYARFPSDPLYREVNSRRRAE